MPSIGSIIQVGLSVNSHLSPAATDSSPMKLFIYTESFINRWLIVILSNAFTFNTVRFIFEIFSIILIQLINNLDIYQWDGNVFLRFPMMCCSTSVSVSVTRSMMLVLSSTRFCWLYASLIIYNLIGYLHFIFATNW